MARDVLAGLLRGDRGRDPLPAEHLLRGERALPEALLDRLLDDRAEVVMPHRDTPTRLLVHLQLDSTTAPEPPEADTATSLRLGTRSFRRIDRIRDEDELTLTFEEIPPCPE